MSKLEPCPNCGRLIGRYASGKVRYHVTSWRKPWLRLEAICEALGVTRTEARRPLTTLAEGGRVHKVGHRWRVKAAR